MWKFLWRALAVLPREITWTFATPFCAVILLAVCMAVVRFAPGGIVPDALLAIAGYVAGVKLIVIMTIVIASVLLAFGLLIARIVSGMRGKS